MRRLTHLAGWAHLGGDSPLVETVGAMGFQPGGGRDLEVIAKRVSTGIQPTRRALPTLLPEGLGELAHLELALKVPHPYTLPVPVPDHCSFAVNGQATFDGD